MTGRGLWVVLVALWVQPACLRAVSMHETPLSCFGVGFVQQSTMAVPLGSSTIGSFTALKRGPVLSHGRQQSRLELRAGLGDAVRGLWPFKKNEEDQYKDRKDVWNSLIMLDQVTGGELQLLIDALTATGLWIELSDGTDKQKKKRPPVTLFASLNSAFYRLPPDCLLSECIETLEDESKNIKPILLEELRTSLLGSIADGRYSISALDGKITAITTRSGGSANLDLMPGTRAADFTDYVLDMELRRKVKVCRCGLTLTSRPVRQARKGKATVLFHGDLCAAAHDVCVCVCVRVCLCVCACACVVNVQRIGSGVTGYSVQQRRDSHR